MTQRIALDIPPGRNGLQPDLAIVYNSQDTANDSIVGYGWSFSIPYIQVLNKVGSQDLYNARYFTSSIDGELATTSIATTTGQTYGAKVDDGHFNSYSFNNNVWTMYDKNGTRYTFGASDNAQQNASASSTQIYKWMLQEIRDTNNNYVRYIYTKDSGQIYPSQIIYTGNGAADGIFTINFTTASRTDVFTSYVPLFTETTNYRISKITASVSGTVVREYNLSYVTGNNGYRSLLASVQENGWNSSGTEVSLPAETFGYISSTTAFVWPSNSSHPVYGGGWVVADVNGNATNDITNFYQTGGSTLGSVLFQDQSTLLTPTPPDYWATDPYCSSTCNDPHMPAENGVRLVDVNADGKADIAKGVFQFGGSMRTSQLYMNTSSAGSYSWATSSWNGVIPEFKYTSDGTDAYSTGILDDINADGLPDYVAKVSGAGSGFTNGTYLGNGSAWDDATTTVFQGALAFSLSTGVDSRLVDVTGTGLPFWLYDGTCQYVLGSHLCFLPNYGNSWAVAGSTYDPNWTIKNEPLSYGTDNPNGSFVLYDRGVRFLDINGDGLPDMLHSYCVPTSITTAGPALPELGCENEVALNTGSGWTATSSTLYTLPAYIVSSPSGPWAGYFNYNEYANWTGGGQEAQDVLQTVTYPKGGTATVSYTKTTQQPNLNPELPYSLLVATKIVASDGLGTSAEKDYAYFGGKQYMGMGVRNRQFAGFASSTVADANSITTTYFDQGDAISTSLGEQNDGYGQINHPFRTDVRRASDNQLLKQVFDRWDTATTAGGNGVFVFKAREVTQDYSLSGSHRDTAADYSYSTSTGNVTLITNYGEVTGNSDGTFTDVGSDKSTETFLYAVSTTTQTTGLPYDDTLVDQSSSKVRETRHTYDGLTLGNVSLGNETKTEAWITSSTYASTTKAYDGTYGLVTQSRDANYNLSTSTLDSYNLYTATTTNPLFQTTGYTYDYSTGKVKTNFDANGRLYTTTYDGVGRPLTINEPDPSTGSLVAKTAYAYTDSNTPGATSVQTTDYLSAASSTNTYQYLDGLGRNLQQRKQFKGNNTYAVKDWTYNNVGLPNSESLPYLASSTARTSATSTSQLFTTYSYDALQRKLTTANAVGTTSNAYNAWTVTTTDANGKLKDYTKDAYGNLITVVEHIGSAYATTSYTWDLNKSLTNITDALGNVRNFTYDGLGRQLTAQDLHASGDSTFGTWNYTWDPASNLKSYTDPNGQTVNNNYDALNRKTTEDFTGQAGIEVSNTYDSCTDGKGRLCVASSTATQTKYSYNPLGLQSVATTTINGTSTAFATQSGYDRQGNQILITYPDGAQVQYNFNNGGLLDAVLEKENGGAFSYIVSNFDYSPLGNPSAIVMGNGAITINSYNQNALYRLSRKVTTVPTGSHVQDLAYTRDPIGNITQIVDNGTAGTGKIVNYGYDDLYRLLSASTTVASSSPFSYSYTLDALGNIMNGPLGTYSYLGSTGTNYADRDAVTAVATTTITIGGGGGISTSTIALTSTTTNITLGFNSTTTKIWTVTTSGSNPLVVLTAGIWQDVGGSGTIGSVSWNGAAFTKATSTRTTANESEIWYLVASTTGSKTISVTINGNTDAIKLGTASYSGVSTSSPFDTVKSANGFSTTPSVSVTPKVTGEVFVGSLARWTTLDATTSLTALYKDYASSTLAAAAYKIATTSSAVTETYTAAGPSQDWVLAMAAFQPATSTTGTASSTSATTTLSYDNNGNLTGEGSSTFSSDYRNQMTQSGNGLATSTYAYDQDGNRVKLTEGSVTTYFPNTLYSTGATTTKNIFANGLLLSTVESAGSGGGNGSTATSTPALVASVAAGAGADSVTTAPIDTTGATFIIAAVSYNTGATPTISDSKGNTWTPLTASTVTGTVSERLYYASNPVVGSGHTFSNTATSNFSSICVAAFSGVATSSPFDKENGATSSLSTIQTGSVTPAVNQELVSTGLGWNVARTTYPPTIDSSFTVSTSSNFASGNHYGCSIGFLSQATSSAVNPTWNLGSAQSNAARIAAFRPLVTAGGGSGTPASTTIRYIATDNLSGANIVLDASGGVAEVLDYAPYGALRMDTKTNYGGVRNKYAGTVNDALSGLNYMQARYQNSSRGQFISEDPVFLGDPRSQVLTDPQTLNSYSYANDNPITKSDPTGKFVPEAVVGAGIGGLVGVTLQGATDLATGRLSSPETYAGAFAGGAVFGGIVGATDGLSLLGLAGAGGISGAVQSGTTQGLSLADGSQSAFSYSDFGVQTITGAVTGIIPGPRIGRVTAGRGSYLAVQNQMFTKLGTGSLVPSQITMQTYGKMFVATGVQQTPSAAVQGVLSNLAGVLRQLNSVLSNISASKGSSTK